MDKEEVIEYSGYVDTTSKEAIEIKNLERVDGEFKNKHLSKILDTPYYMGVHYLFSYEKVQALFNKYKEKYGVEEDWYDGKKYTSYKEWENGGVSEVRLSDTIGEKELEEKVFSASMSLEIHGGKQFGWGGKPFYRVEFFCFREHNGNFIGHINVDSVDLAVTALREFTECIERLDTDDVFDRIHGLCNDIKKTSSIIDKLSTILNESLKR